jgi:hypothetical protein
MLVGECKDLGQRSDNRDLAAPARHARTYFDTVIAIAPADRHAPTAKSALQETTAVVFCSDACCPNATSTVV